VSSIVSTVFGNRAKDGQVVDTTAQQYQNLRGPLGQQLLQQLMSPQRYTGPFTAMFSPQEQQALTGVNAAAQQAGTPGAGQQMLGGAAGFNPFAQLTGLEQFGMGQVAGQAFSNPMLGPGQAFLSQQLGGQMNPYAQAAGMSGAEQQGLQSIQQQAFGFNPLSNTINQQVGMIAGGGPNPMIDQLIQSATRPILENFGDEQLAQRGAFTAAGHQVQGRGSSPFAQASARLATGAMNATGDVATQIAAQEQQRQMHALQLGAQLPGMQLQNMLGAQAALGLPREIQQTGLNLQNQAFGQMQQNQFGALAAGDQMQGNALQRALAGLEAAGTGQERQGAAFEDQQNRQLQAGGELGQQQLAGQMGQLQAQLQNLQAQGLPRMVQQLGIDAGLQQFNQQQTQLLQLMQLMGGLTQGNSVVTPGTQASTGLAGAFLQGLSDRRMKRDIEHVATLPSGTKLYRFRYIEGDVTHIGVMADEVAHIPGAVMVDEITGLATVDYGKVFKHAA
jgi:hypothetical protein